MANAHGPYSHGVWSNGKSAIGADEALEGRPETIVENFIKTMLSHYTLEEIAEMTLIDVGCYDSFLTVQIEKQLPFSKIYGLEPRRQNIAKGEFVREYLSIDTNIEIIEGGIEDLERLGLHFDIVFCSGLLHHLTNASDGVNLLAKSAKKAVFIESQCYAPLIRNKLISGLIDRYNRTIIEPKDIIYNSFPKIVGTAGFKLETNYYDGSSNDLSIVCVPSPELLKLSLLAAGLTETLITLSPIEYRKKTKSKLRNFRSVCLFGLKRKKSDFEKAVSSTITKYEFLMLSHRVSPLVIGYLNNKKGIFGFIVNYLIRNQFGRLTSKFVNFFLRAIVSSDVEFEIVKNVKYNPTHKIKFENAKILFLNNQFEHAEEKLRELVDNENTDWRVFYRSCALLWVLHSKKSDKKGAAYWQNLLLVSNPNYPTMNIIDDLNKILEKEN